MPPILTRVKPGLRKIHTIQGLALILWLALVVVDALYEALRRPASPFRRAGTASA